MRSFYFACLVVAVFAFLAYADEEIGEAVTNYETYTVFQISDIHTDKPFYVPMPDYWDGDMGNVRVKAIYRDDASPRGVSALYLNKAATPRFSMPGENGDNVMNIVVGPQQVDIKYIHFVFRQKKGTVCISPD